MGWLDSVGSGESSTVDERPGDPEASVEASPDFGGKEVATI
jgi:hypothetical protein